MASACWARRGGGRTAPALVHQGNRIFVPENSVLRQRLTVQPAPAETKSAIVTAPGIVESDPARTVAVLPPGAGRVREVKVALGERVQRGQPLATIDSPDLAQAYDDNDKAASVAVLAAKNLHYQEEQLKIGAAAQRDLDQARSDNEQAIAEYARTRAHLRAMGAAEDAHGEARLLMVRAPVAGSVTALSGRTGRDDQRRHPVDHDGRGSVGRVGDGAGRRGGRCGRHAQPGRRGHVDAYPGKTLHGKVLFVSDVIEPDSRRDKTRIAFDNPDAYLKPNMFATVTLHGTAVRRVVLPSSALLMNNDRTSVFVATAPWTFERRIVEPLLEESSKVADRVRRTARRAGGRQGRNPAQ